MEFPEIGQHCSWSQCKTLDFLPFTCSHCNKVFCKEHFNVDSHECKTLNQICDSKVSVKSFYCSFEECKTFNSVEMLCAKCNKHFCLLHKFHNCFDVTSDIEERKKQLNETKEKFNKSLKIAQTAVNEKIQKAVENPKKQATAMKIQLMKLKAKAEGSSSIPSVDRVYFLIALPKNLKKNSKAVFVNKDWSIGKVIDSVSDICNVINKNNELLSPKLRLFKTNGSQIFTDTSLKIFNLIDSKIIVNGETLILEYINASEDISNYSLDDCSCYHKSMLQF